MHGRSYEASKLRAARHTGGQVYSPFTDKSSLARRVGSWSAVKMQLHSLCRTFCARSARPQVPLRECRKTKVSASKTSEFAVLAFIELLGATSCLLPSPPCSGTLGPIKGAKVATTLRRLLCLLTACSLHIQLGVPDL